MRWIDAVFLEFVYVTGERWLVIAMIGSALAWVIATRDFGVIVRLTYYGIP